MTSIQSNQTNRPPKLGLIIPHTENKATGIRCWVEIREVAKIAEDIGFDSLWVVDHLLFNLQDNDPPKGVGNSGRWFKSSRAHQLLLLFQRSTTAVVPFHLNTSSIS